MFLYYFLLHCNTMVLQLPHRTLATFLHLGSHNKGCLQISLRTTGSDVASSSMQPWMGTPHLVGVICLHSTCATLFSMQNKNCLPITFTLWKIWFLVHSSLKVPLYILVRTHFIWIINFVFCNIFCGFYIFIIPHEFVSLNYG